MADGGKYLLRHGEAECAWLTGFPALQWDYCLLIPAFAESADFFERLAGGLLRHHRVLLVVVINQPDRLPEIHPLNQRLAARIHRETVPIWRQGNLSLHGLPGGSAVLLVDRYSAAPIPSRQGVGLARKIAADLAATLIQRRQIASPWLFCSDADGLLPANYFHAAGTAQPAAALLYPFRHRVDDSPVGRATLLYEISLRHYVAGLAAAGSPYAFHTIGSTIAMHSSHYALVRGFPRRAGGEDFYLLNKLAKTGPVRVLDQPEIEIEARLSTRVPFGTGPAVQGILALDNPEEEYGFYNPGIFRELRHWLAIMPGCLADEEAWHCLAANTRDTLASLGVASAIAHSRRHGRDMAAFTRHMHTWFDGFMTLKFVHGLQARGLKPVPLSLLAPAPQGT